MDDRTGLTRRAAGNTAARITNIAAAFMACFGLGSCATQTKLAEASLAQIEEWLPGRYDNVDQAKEDVEKGVEPHIALSLSIVRVRVPLLGDRVFYLQESAADDANRVTMQRLLSFDIADDGRVFETIYTLTEPARWRQAGQNPDLFVSLMIRDASPLVGCEIFWKKSKEGASYTAANQRATCRVTASALGGSANLDLRAELAADRLAMAELAFNAAGQVVQGNVTEPFYRYHKRTTP
jgi:hypothetical protein